VSTVVPGPNAPAPDGSYTLALPLDEVAAQVPEDQPLTSVVHPMLVDAPLVYVDFSAIDLPPVYPCNHCPEWHVEVLAAGTQEAVVREWHAPACPTLEQWR
jgi:hypothetical protein